MLETGHKSHDTDINSVRQNTQMHHGKHFLIYFDISTVLAGYFFLIFNLAAFSPTPPPKKKKKKKKSTLNNILRHYI